MTAIDKAAGREHERSPGLEVLRHALIEGERSGEPQDFDFEAFIHRKHAQQEG